MRRIVRSGVACLLAILLFSCISTGETVESSQQEQTALDAGADDGLVAFRCPAVPDSVPAEAISQIL